MVHLKSRLSLESLDGRVLPDATPLAPPGDQTNVGQTDPSANALGSGRVDFSNWDSANGPCTMTISVTDANGNRVNVTVEIGSNATPTDVAQAIVNAFQAAGISGVGYAPPAKVDFTGFQGTVNFAVVGPNGRIDTPGIDVVTQSNLTFTLHREPVPVTATEA